jgi:hypothetical protein
MSQDPDEINKSYETQDPWKYQVTPDDHTRKKIIIETAHMFAPPGGHFMRALDLGAGEAWITKDLPAIFKHGYELSANAAKRFPEGVYHSLEPAGPFDLVTAMGVLYEHYDYDKFFKLMAIHANNVLITCNIKTWERNEMADEMWVRKYLGMKQVLQNEFPYREWTQMLRVFKKIGA